MEIKEAREIGDAKNKANFTFGELTEAASALHNLRVFDADIRRRSEILKEIKSRHSERTR
jgi:hypothetical protein